MALEWVESMRRPGIVDLKTFENASSKREALLFRLNRSKGRASPRNDWTQWKSVATNGIRKGMWRRDSHTAGPMNNRTGLDR
jgi:hypothetical protein